MKRFVSMFLLSIMLLTAICPVASAAIMGGPGINYRMELQGDYIPAPVSSAYTVSGQKLSDGYQHIFTRFGKFAIAHDCHVYLWLWKSLDSLSCQYDSFEAAVEGMEENAGENAVCILYFGDLNEAYVHVGSEVIPDYDTGRLEELLCSPVAVDEFSQFVSIFDTLSADAGEAAGKYATYIERPGKVEEQAIRDAVKPLHEVFPGYVCVDYRSTHHETFSSILRAFREIDYDEEYALWEHEWDYYYRDAIYITYYGDTGDAFIDIGEESGIKLSDAEIQKLEMAFEAAANESDCSGFAVGVAALAEAVAASTSSGGENSSIVIAAAVAMILLAVVILVKVKKRT